MFSLFSFFDKATGLTITVILNLYIFHLYSLELHNVVLINDSSIENVMFNLFIAFEEVWQADWFENQFLN